MFRNGAQATAGASEQASSTSIMWALQCCNTVEENLNKIGTVVGSSYWTLKSNDWKRTSTVQYAFQQLATQKLGVAPTEPRNMGTVQARYTTSPASCWWSEWLQCTVFETEIMMACVCVCVCAADSCETEQCSWRWCEEKRGLARMGGEEQSQSGQASFDPVRYSGRSTIRKTRAV